MGTLSLLKSFQSHACAKKIWHKWKYSVFVLSKASSTLKIYFGTRWYRVWKIKCPILRCWPPDWLHADSGLIKMAAELPESDIPRSCYTLGNENDFGMLLYFHLKVSSHIYQSCSTIYPTLDSRHVPQRAWLSNQPSHFLPRQTRILNQVSRSKTKHMLPGGSAIEWKQSSSPERCSKDAFLDTIFKRHRN